jgi:hypothetical protein
VTPAEAKTWLIEQILIEADRESMHLDELERQMLAFSETTRTPPNFAELNAAFEIDHDNVEYEDKIAGLARNRLQGLGAIDSTDVARWREAVALLSEEDHYLLVMINMADREPPSLRIDDSLSARPPHDRLKLILTAAAIVIAMLIALSALDHLGIDLPSRR